MKNLKIILFLLFFFLPIILWAGSLDDARSLEKMYFRAAIKVKAIPTSNVCTGFFTNAEQDSEKLIFTTAKHIVENASELHLTILLADLAETTFDPITLRVPLFKDTVKLYYDHPDIDLVLLIVERDSIEKARLERGLGPRKYFSFPYDFYTNIGSLFTGQPVLFPGYPLGLTVNGGKPLLRKGSIAGIDRAAKVVYLDADAFGGSSGSPVFIDFSSQANVEFFKYHEQILVGMISGYIFEQRPLINEKGRTEMLQKENTGIAIVVPAETIREMADTLFSKQR